MNFDPALIEHCEEAMSRAEHTRSAADVETAKKAIRAVLDDIYRQLIRDMLLKIIRNSQETGDVT